MGFWNFIEAGRSRSWAFGILQKLGEVEVGELRLTLKPTPELAFLFPNPAQEVGRAPLLPLLSSFSRSVSRRPEAYLRSLSSPSHLLSTIYFSE